VRQVGVGSPHDAGACAWGGFGQVGCVCKYSCSSRRQNVRAGLCGERMQGTDTRTPRACRRGLCRRRFCCRLCLWKHAQCTGQSMRRWVIRGSPGLLLCSTCWQSVRLSSHLLDHSRSPQTCSSTVLLGTVLVHTPLAVCLRLLLSYDPGRVIGHRVCRGSEQASMPRDGPKAEWATPVGSEHTHVGSAREHTVGWKLKKLKFFNCF